MAEDTTSNNSVIAVLTFDDSSEKFAPFSTPETSRVNVFYRGDDPGYAT